MAKHWNPGNSRLVYNDGRFFIQYFELLFPVSPRSYYSILNQGVESLKEALGEENAAYHEFSGILASTLELARGDRRVENAAERRMRFESARDRLRSLANTSPEVARLLKENIAEINGKEGDPGILRPHAALAGRAKLQAGVLAKPE